MLFRCIINILLDIDYQKINYYHKIKIIMAPKLSNINKYDSIIKWIEIT